MLPEASHAKSTDKLVYMANQIGKFFAGQEPELAVSGTAEHIKKFWDPRMRAAIFAYLEEGGAGLDASVRQAIENLRKAAAKT
jgi:formate dehydrogenase subunit delta